MSSSVQLSRCKDCGILLPSSKMVLPHSHDLSVNRKATQNPQVNVTEDTADVCT